MTVREAGLDKQPNRQLVYGGGSLTALALDVELRKRSDDRSREPTAGADERARYDAMFAPVVATPGR